MNQLEVIETRPNVKLGRKLTSGKYESREDLVSNILRLYRERQLSPSSIGRICKVSSVTVVSVLKREGIQ